MNKQRKTSNLINIFDYDSSNNVTATGSVTATSFTGSLQGTASTASFAPNYTLTSSFNQFTQSYYQDSSSFDSRINNLPISQLVREEFTWVSGSSQIFQLLSTASQVYSVEVQGQGALSQTQYTVTGSNRVQILDQLQNNDYVVVLYTNATTGFQPYYSQAQVDGLVNNKELLSNKSTSTSLGTSDTLYPTQNAVKTYVDNQKEVLEFADLSAFPVTGETGKIYLALDTNFTYRWSGSAYVQIGGEQQSYKVITKNVVNSSVVTGTTAYVTVHTFNIPENTFQVGDLIGIRMRSLKTGTLGAMNARADISGWAVVFQSAAASRFNSFDRTAVIKSASVTEELTGTTNLAVTTGAIIQNYQTNIDWAVSQTLNISLQLFNSGDSAVVSFFELYRIR